VPAAGRQRRTRRASRTAIVVIDAKVSAVPG
jgi:hypothetical protein